MELEHPICLEKGILEALRPTTRVDPYTGRRRCRMFSTMPSSHVRYPLPVSKSVYLFLYLNLMLHLHLHIYARNERWEKEREPKRAL